MKKLLLSAAALLLLAVCAHADLIIGTANNGNCIPWSCNSTGGDGYQQIYNNADFPGSIDISSISFYNTFFNNGGSQGIATMDYSIYLRATSQLVPDGTGTGTLFASGHLSDGPWTFGNTLTFTGTPFLFDPGSGLNLELTVLISNASDPGSGVFTYFDEQENGGPFSRWCPGCGSNEGVGLVTGFGTATTTPEPGSLILMGSGLLAVAGTIRRKLSK
jgi:hypothetical protein